MAKHGHDVAEQKDRLEDQQRVPPRRPGHVLRTLACTFALAQWMACSWVKPALAQHRCRATTGRDCHGVASGKTYQGH